MLNARYKYKPEILPAALNFFKSKFCTPYLKYFDAFLFHLEEIVRIENQIILQSHGFARVVIDFILFLQPVLSTFPKRFLSTIAELSVKQLMF